jgi:hypothetical protein
MWELLFWGSIALILYTYFGYPVALYLIGRLRPRKSRAVSGSGRCWRNRATPL